jgi:small subunit ribosomal protein S1
MTTEPNENPEETMPAVSPAQPSSEAAATSGPAEDSGAKGRIKIGTQRSGVVAPKIPPRTQTVFTTAPPVETPRRAPRESNAPNDATEESAIVAQPIRSEPAKQTSPEDQPPSGEAETAERKPANDETKPQPRPKPAPLAASNIQKRPSFEQQGAKIPRPNLRAELSADLQEELAESLGDLSMEEMLATDERSKQAAQALEPETRVKARVMRVHRDNVFVELPAMNQGVIPLKNFAEPPAPGTMLDVVIARYNAEEGLYELASLSGAVDIGDWSDITEGITIEARITGHNKGGLECEVNHIRGFIPMGQISQYRVEDLDQFVGQKLPCVVTEANPDRRNLVLSHRAVLEREAAEAKQKLLAELAEGQEREGLVRNIRDFGAFVDLGGVDGMLHISQLSWERVKHPSEVLHVGQKIKVKIQKIDQATGKIGLSYRDTFENPWTKAQARYPVTARVKGTVSKIMDFGAFVRLEPGVEGLVHISELSHKRVFRVGEVVKEGQEIEAKVLSVDPEAQRMSLSMKALEARAEPEAGEDEPPPEVEAPTAKKSAKRTVPLKGGLGRAKGGEEFGLRW